MLERKLCQRSNARRLFATAPAVSAASVASAAAASSAAVSAGAAGATAAVSSVFEECRRGRGRHRRTSGTDLLDAIALEIQVKLEVGVTDLQSKSFQGKCVLEVLAQFECPWALHPLLQGSSMDHF